MPEENFLSDMMNINAVLGPTIGGILELHKLLKTPEAKLWRDVAFNKLLSLTQVSKKQTNKVTNIIHLISPNQKHTNKKATYS